MGKVYLVASGKGGTGKTMFAVNLGATLAKQGKKVVIMDFDMGLRNLDLYMGLENNVVYDVHDVLTGLCRIRQALIKDRRFENLYLMAASPVKSDGRLTPMHMQVLTEKLKNYFDYIIVDAPSGIDDGLVISSAGADETIIVTTPDFSAIRDGDNLARELMKLGINKNWLIINKVSPGLMTNGYVPGLAEITSAIKAEPVGIIQLDDNIQISTNLGVPIVMKEGTYIEENFNRIAERMMEF